MAQRGDSGVKRAVRFAYTASCCAALAIEPERRAVALFAWTHGQRSGRAPLFVPGWTPSARVGVRTRSGGAETGGRSRPSRVLQRARDGCEQARRFIRAGRGRVFPARMRSVHGGISRVRSHVRRQRRACASGDSWWRESAPAPVSGCETRRLRSGRRICNHTAARVPSQALGELSGVRGVGRSGTLSAPSCAWAYGNRGASCGSACSVGRRLLAASAADGGRYGAVSTEGCADRRARVSLV